MHLEMCTSNLLLLLRQHQLIYRYPQLKRFLFIGEMKLPPKPLGQLIVRIYTNGDNVLIKTR